MKMNKTEKAFIGEFLEEARPMYDQVMNELSQTNPREFERLHAESVKLGL